MYTETLKNITVVCSIASVSTLLPLKYILIRIPQPGVSTMIWYAKPLPTKAVSQMSAGLSLGCCIYSSLFVDWENSSYSASSSNFLNLEVTGNASNTHMGDPDGVPIFSIT